MFLFIVVYLVLVLIRPQDYPQYADLGIPLLPLTLGLAMLLWLFGARKPFDAPQYPLLFFFLFALMMSEIANGWWGGAIEQLTQFGPVLAAFILVAQSVNTRKRVIQVMVVFVLCTVVLAAHGIEQAELGTGWTGTGLIQDGRIQYVGIFNDPNDLGLLFVMVLPMAVYLSGGGGWMGLKRLFWLAAAAAIVYAIVLTDSRGTLLSLVAMLGVWVWRRKGMVMAGILGGGVMTAMLALPSRLQQLDVEEASAYGRVEAWYQGLQMAASNPLFGVGATRFAEFNANLTAHNSFVLVLAETGFFGFTIWLAFVVYCFSMTLAVMRHQPELADGAAEFDWKREQTLALTLFLSLVAFFSAAFFLSRSYIVLLYLLAGLVVGYYSSARERYPDLPAFRLGQDFMRWPFVALGAAFGLYIVVKILYALL
jgi:O-antigen ligase